MWIICLDLVVFLAVGATLAYIFTSTDPVVNTFTPVTPDIVITEDPFNGSIKENVIVKNTGTVSSYIRSQVVITWQNEVGEVFSTTPVLDTADNDGDYTILYGTAEDAMDTEYWTFAADGFWYYSKAVEPGADTDALIVEAKWIKACEDPSYTLHIEILSQSVQSTPDKAVDVWDNAKVDVTGNAGTLTVVTPQTN